MNRPTTLFVTDLDGTLLGPDSKVSAKSARIISDLSRRGALITVATARTPATVEPLLRDTFTTIPAIVMTGASMWDREAHRFIEPILMPSAQAATLEEAFLACGINPFVYTVAPDGTMSVRHSPEMTDVEQQFYDGRKSLSLKKFLFESGRHCRREVTLSTPVILMLGIGSTPEVNRLAETLRPDETLSISAYPDIFNPLQSYIEVFHAGVSKAEAVLRLKDQLGAERLVVYGDHLNDLPMFAVADESVAVANAHPSVIEAATRTIGPNTLPSVANDIKACFLAGC